MPRAAATKSTYKLRQRLVDIALGEVGVSEIGKTNTGRRVREFQAATDLGGTGWPWCAAFVCWCIRAWLKDGEVRAALNLPSLAAAEHWRPKHADAYGFRDWAHEKGLLILNDSQANTLHTADLVTYDFSHIGILDTDRGTKIYTIEGNTDGEGSREGGCVAEKIRERKIARDFIRLLA